MTWNLFIDDDRNLEDVTWAPWQIREKYRNEEWIVCRDLIEVAYEVTAHGSLPSFVSFDHDLGENKSTGYDIAQMMVKMDLDKAVDTNGVEYSLSVDFDFYVHSKNPIGKANIEGLLSNYLKHKEQ